MLESRADDPNRHIGAALGKTRFGPCKKRTAWSIAGRRLDVSRVFSKFSFLPLHDEWRVVSAVEGELSELGAADQAGRGDRLRLATS